MIQTQTQTQTIPEVMTVPELARFLRIGLSTAYALVRSGEIQSTRCGKQIRISLDSVLAYLHGQK